MRRLYTDICLRKAVSVDKEQSGSTENIIQNYRKI